MKGERINFNQPRMPAPGGGGRPGVLNFNGRVPTLPAQIRANPRMLDDIINLGLPMHNPCALFRGAGNTLPALVSEQAQINRLFLIPETLTPEFRPELRSFLNSIGTQTFRNDHVLDEVCQVLEKGDNSVRYGLAWATFILVSQAHGGNPPDPKKAQNKIGVPQRLFDALTAAEKALADAGVSGEFLKGFLGAYGLLGYIAPPSDIEHQSETPVLFSAENLRDFLVNGYSNAAVVKRAVAWVLANLAMSGRVGKIDGEQHQPRNFLLDFEKNIAYVRLALSDRADYESVVAGLNALNFLVPAFMFIGARGQQLHQEFKKTLVNLYVENQRRLNQINNRITEIERTLGGNGLSDDQRNSLESEQRSLERERAQREDLKTKVKMPLRLVFSPENVTTWGPDIDVLIGQHILADRAYEDVREDCQRDFPDEVVLSRLEANETVFPPTAGRPQMEGIFRQALTVGGTNISVFLVNEPASSVQSNRDRSASRKQQIEKDPLIKRMLGKIFSVFGLVNTRTITGFLKLISNKGEKEELSPGELPLTRLQTGELPVAGSDLHAFVMAIAQALQIAAQRTVETGETNFRIYIQIDTGYGTRTVHFSPAEFRNKGNQRFGYRNQALASAIASLILQTEFPNQGVGRVHLGSSDNILLFFNNGTILKSELMQQVEGCNQNIIDELFDVNPNNTSILTPKSNWETEIDNIAADLSLVQRERLRGILKRTHRVLCGVQELRNTRGAISRKRLEKKLREADKNFSASHFQQVLEALFENPAAGSLKVKNNLNMRLVVDQLTPRGVITSDQAKILGRVLNEGLPYYTVAFRSAIESPVSEENEEQAHRRFEALTGLGTTSVTPNGRLRRFFEKVGIFLIRAGMREAVLFYLKQFNACPQSYEKYIEKEDKDLTELGHVEIGDFFKEVFKSLMSALPQDGNAGEQAVRQAAEELFTSILDNRHDSNWWHRFFYSFYLYQTGQEIPDLEMQGLIDILRKKTNSLNLSDGEFGQQSFFGILCSVGLGCGATCVNTFNMNMSQEFAEIFKNKWMAMARETGDGSFVENFPVEAGYSNYFNTPLSLTKEAWRKHKKARELMAAAATPEIGHQIVDRVWDIAHETLIEITGSDQDQVGVAIVDYFTDIGTLRQVTQAYMEIFGSDSGMALAYRLLLGLEPDKNFEEGVVLGDYRIISSSAREITVQHTVTGEILDPIPISDTEPLIIGGVKISKPTKTYLGGQTQIKANTTIGEGTILLDADYQPVPVGGDQTLSVDIPSYTILNGVKINGRLHFIKRKFDQTVSDADKNREEQNRLSYLCNLTLTSDRGVLVVRPDMAYSDMYSPGIADEDNPNLMHSGEEIVASAITPLPGQEPKKDASGGYNRENCQSHKTYPIFGSGFSVEDSNAFRNGMTLPAGRTSNCVSPPRNWEVLP